jgi:hypothetical protein
MEDRAKYETANEGRTRGVLVFPVGRRIVVATSGHARRKREQMWNSCEKNSAHAVAIQWNECG